MGIKGFWSVIKDVGETKTLAEWSEEHIRKHGRPLRIAVDEAHWRYKAPNTAEIAEIRKGAPESRPIERNIMYKIFRLLRLGIHPIFVFDGDLRPAEKRRRKSRHGTAVDKVDLLKELLDHLNIPRHQAPGEAEAECARLQQLDIVDAVWTEDNDIFMFGCEVLVKKTSSPDAVEIFRMEDIRRRGFSREGVVLFAMLSGCDYTKGLLKCGSAIALQVLQSKAVQEGDLLQEFWDIETETARTTWCKRLKCVLPNGKLRENVHDLNFAAIKVLQKCRSPIVSGPARLERVRHKSFRGYPLEKLKTTIPFLQAHFNLNKKPTWPLEQLAPIELAYRLLNKDPGARELVEAFKQKNKPRPTSPIAIDPVRVFPGINAGPVRATLFDTNLITLVNEELLDAICGFGISWEEFQRWRGSKMKARSNQREAKEFSTPKTTGRKRVPTTGSRTPSLYTPPLNKGINDQEPSRKRRATEATVRKSTSFELLQRGASDDFWKLSQDSVDAIDEVNVARTSGKLRAKTRHRKRSSTSVVAALEQHPAKQLWANGKGQSYGNPVVLDD